MITAQIFLNKRHSDLAEALKYRYSLKYPEHEVSISLVDGLIHRPILHIERTNGLPNYTAGGSFVPVDSVGEEAAFLYKTYLLLYRQTYGRLPWQSDL